MTDETPAPDPAAEPETETPELGEPGKRAIAAERKRAETAEKALKALQLEAETRANAELSELERFKKENEALIKAQTEASLESIRLKVALEKGIPANLAARLQGDDYDSIAADADSLAELVGQKITVPKADPSQGPKAEVGAQSPAAAFGAIINSLNSGR